MILVKSLGTGRSTLGAIRGIPNPEHLRIKSGARVGFVQAKQFSENEDSKENLGFEKRVEEAGVCMSLHAR